MERESFEDEEVAQLLNRGFVAIKVDREERPDIDHIYMTVCQALTGQGGWPLTLILTPDQHPIFAGTYFPKESRFGRPGLMDVLRTVLREWEKDAEGLSMHGRDLMGKVNEHFASDTQGEWDASLLDDAYRWFDENFDPDFGGFAGAPKFPTPHNLMFLLRYQLTHPTSRAGFMVMKTLNAMAEGGIYDHVGGGFARYSTDARWLVPHFEKMLYDNALLALVYTEAYQVTGEARYKRIVEGILGYVTRDMTHAQGAFYSAEDADSEGEEGKFYLFTPAEVIQILGDKDGKAYCEMYDITESGNFEGKNIPNRIRSGGLADDAAVSSWNERLRQARERRVRPHLDDKVLFGWNALMISAFARAGRVFGDPMWIKRAQQAAGFLQQNLVDDRGRILARYRDGESKFLGYVDDLAYGIWSMLELFDSTANPDYLEQAIRWQSDMQERFWDDKSGGFFYSSVDGEPLVARPKEIYDGATPSGNSVAAHNLVRLARLTGDARYESLASTQLSSFARAVKEYPSAHAFYLVALQLATMPPRELVVAGKAQEPAFVKAFDTVSRGFYPFLTSLFVSDGEQGRKLGDLVPFVKEYPVRNGQTTFYSCENFACRQPTNRLEEVLPTN